ncbi:hypothetical protein ABQE45_16035 [Mycobacteroides chelonae]
MTTGTKDLIIRGGHNIDPATTEDVPLSHPAATGAAAVQTILDCYAVTAQNRRPS